MTHLQNDLNKNTDKTNYRFPFSLKIYPFPLKIYPSNSYINICSGTKPLLIRDDLTLQLIHLGVFPLNFSKYFGGVQRSELVSRISWACAGKGFINNCTDRDPVFRLTNLPRLMRSSSAPAAANCFTVEQRRNFQYRLIAPWDDTGPGVCKMAAIMLRLLSIAS